MNLSGTRKLGSKSLRNLLLFLVGASLVSLVHAVPKVANVRAAQRTGTKLVDITYDLSNPSGNSTVQVEISVNGGRSWDVPVRTISGDVGDGVAPGANRSATWNAGADFDGNLADQCRARVTAYEAGTPIAPIGMAFIPSGSFQMGAEIDGSVPTVVTITESYFIDKTEITNWTWDLVEQWGNENGYSLSGGSQGHGDGSMPSLSIWVYWILWANARSEMEGLKPCYYVDDTLTDVIRQDISSTPIGNVINSRVDWRASGYRLPTSAEWEKAARAGTTGKRYPWGDTISHDQANYYSDESLSYDVSTTREAHPLATLFLGRHLMRVGSFDPNGYGLYDVSGNAFEWVWDGISGSNVSYTSVDPRGLEQFNEDRGIRSGGGDGTADSATLGRIFPNHYASNT